MLPGSSFTGTINDPKAGTPSYASASFDPNGKGNWSAAWDDPVAAIGASGLGLLTKYISTPNEYPNDAGNLQNDTADAFRHALWNVRMTHLLGPEKAKNFADAHEISEVNPDDQRMMDLYNNQIARNLAAANPGISDVELVRQAI